MNERQPRIRLSTVVHGGGMHDRRQALWKLVELAIEMQMMPTHQVSTYTDLVFFSSPTSISSAFLL